MGRSLQLEYGGRCYLDFVLFRNAIRHSVKHDLEHVHHYQWRIRCNPVDVVLNEINVAALLSLANGVMINGCTLTITVGKGAADFCVVTTPRPVD